VEILENLNPAQKEAVLHKNGPLLIIAGAGTGKTRVLTHRFCHLIQNENIDPESILALTFTEKATVEMQERLDVLLPYGYSELWVKTFHGFCDAVLRERGLEIGLDTAYQILTQTDVALFLKKHLFSFELNYYRPLGNPLRFLTGLVTHFGHLRDEMISPEVYLKHAENQVKKAEDDAEKEEAEKLLELAKAYVHYDELLVKEGVLDFATLQYLTLDLFRKRPSVLKEFQNRFQYILVDEFQDTNTAQNRLVELLSEKHRNVMVVGDDDQSIYKWRGASLSNIMQFEERFPETKKIVLTENYRSTQPVLDMSYKVIQNNNPFRLETREGLSKQLVSNVADSPKVPHIIHFENYQEEVKFVVEHIQRYVQENKDVSYKDIAILVRATNHALPFLDGLKRAAVPTYFSGAQGLYQRPEIKDLMAVLRSISNPFDDIALFRMLSMPIFGFESEYLVSLLQKARSSSSALLKTLRQAQKTPDLFSVIDNSLDKFLALFENLQKSVKDQATSQILGFFMKESGYLQALQNNDSPESIEQLQNIATFSQIIRTFEETQGSPRLIECLDYLQSRHEMGDRSSPAEEDLDADTVKILTIHAGKGLEFDTVFMVDLVQNRFPSINRRDPFEVPSELMQTPIDEQASHLHEERRLFYVACTRARKHLFLTYSDYYDGKRRWKPSIFIKEAIETKIPDLSQETSPSIAVANDLEDQPLLIKMDQTFRPLKLSFSRIDAFKRCPLRYKFQYIYHLAEPMSHSLSFGSSIHNALNVFYQDLKHGKKPSLDLLKDLFEKHWIPLGYTSPAHLQARKQQGMEILERFYETQQENWVIPAFLERPFTLKIPSGLRISGRIDRIDRLSDGTYEIIDYKTGRLKEQKAVDKDLQLSIYALACKNVLKLPVSKLSLYYLADNKKITTTRSPEVLQSTEQELEQISTAIKTSDFEPTPSPMICKYCEYRLVCNKSVA
jgi:DNA helicase II / ATP-dependent DNA helicase PcrA